MASGSDAGEVTTLLRAWRGGDDVAHEQLLRRVYQELHAIAARQLRGERRGHTLQPTALVHEAYLRLLGQTRIDWRDRLHFFGIAAVTMRRILVDHARARLADKRAHYPVSLSLAEGASAEGPVPAVEVLDLDRALDRLAESYPRAARVVELRFFGGLDVEQAAAALDLSPRTVKRDLAFARAWLLRELAGDPAR